MRTMFAALALALAFVTVTPSYAQEDQGPPAADMAAAPDAAAPTDMAKAAPELGPLPSGAEYQEGAELIQKAVGAGTARDWRALGAAIIMLVVFIMRVVVGRWVVFFKTDRGGAVMAIVVGVLGTVASMLAAGGAWQWSMLIDGLLAAFTAAGGYATMKKLIAPSDAAA